MDQDAKEPQVELVGDISEAERAIIGTLLVDPTTGQEALRLLSPEDFYHLDTRAAFKGILELKKKSVVADIITLSRHLRTKSDWIEGGSQGPEMLRESQSACSSPQYLKYYINVVVKARQERSRDRALEAYATNRTAETAKVLLEASRDFEAEDSGIFDFEKDLGAAMDALLKKREHVIYTGFAQLDRVIEGSEAGDVLVIGARTNGGKTAIKTQMFFNMGSSKHRCLYATTEMTEAQILGRILPAASGIPIWKFRKKEFNEYDVSKMLDTCAESLSKLPLRVLCKSRPSVTDIRKAVIETSPRVVFIDYLQRLQHNHGDNMAYRVQDTMVNLKTLAQEQNCVVVVGCQLDRKRDKAPDIAPTLSDLKDSAGIEAEADQVILLWQPGELDKDSGPPPEENQTAIEALIAKNRHGRAGVRAHLSLDAEYLAFVEREVKEDSVQTEIDNLGSHA
jgi:replicative DNA helicase